MAGDHACYAFQLPAYTEHFSCVALDLPGSGESDKPAGPYSTDGYADQVASFLDMIGSPSLTDTLPPFPMYVALPQRPVPGFRS